MNNLYERELHARPSIPIEAPKLISTIAFMVKDKEGDKDNQNSENEYLSKIEIERFFEEIFIHYKNKYPLISIKKCSGTDNLDKFKYDDCETQTSIQRSIQTENKKKIIYLVLLQKHLSFFCITFVADIPNKDQITESEWSAIPNEIRQNSIISRAIFKTNLRVEKFEPNEREQDYNLERIFNTKNNDKKGYKIEDVFINLFGSKVSDGGAIIWTPFRSFDDGFNRILVRDISLKPGRLGRLVHRLIEVDLYLSVALRNFHSAREQLNKLKGYEYEISKQLDNFKNNKNYHGCYSNISDKATELANDIAINRYELQAALAYSDLVWQRINEFREERIEGWTRIGYFLEKTFRPGIRTCEAVLRSQNAVSQEIQGVANLLQAGLGLSRQEQEHKIKIVVEFLALFAITYYISYIVIHIVKECKMSLFCKMSSFYCDKVCGFLCGLHFNWPNVSPIVLIFLIFIYFIAIKFSKNK